MLDAIELHRINLNSGDEDNCEPVASAAKNIGENEEEALSSIGTLLRLSCICHSINLVIFDLVKVIQQKDGCFPLKNAIEKANKIASLSHTSAIFKERIPFSIPMKAPTRWNYQINTIEKLLECSSGTLNAALEHVRKRHLILSSQERSLLSDLVRAMAPISCIITKSQSNSITIASVMFIFYFVELLTFSNKQGYSNVIGAPHQHRGIGEIDEKLFTENSSRNTSNFFREKIQRNF